MSIRWAEPSEPYGGSVAAAIQGPWAQIDTDSWNFSTANPRTGTQHFRMSPGLFDNKMIRRVHGDSLTEIKVGMAIYCDTMPSSENVSGSITSGQGHIELCSLRDAANGVQLTWVLGTNGQLVLYRGGHVAGTGMWVLETFIERSDPTILLPARAYSHLEFYADIHPSNGAVEVRLNEVTIQNLSGLQTQATGNTESSQFAMVKGGIGTCSSFIDIDDLIVSDPSGSYNVGFVGDKKAFYFPPTSDGPDSDFDVSTGGTSYSVLDEMPPNDSDYLSMGPGLTGKTSVGVGDLPGNTASVSAVIAMVRSWKDDAGTCDMKPGILQGATYASGAGQHQTTAPNYYFQVFEADPVSGVPFTPTEVNSLDLVIERSA